VEKLSRKPIIAITMGDPSGIGPEIIVKALQETIIYDICQPIVVGDSQVMIAAVNLISAPLEIKSRSMTNEAEGYFNTIDVLDLKNIDLEKFQFGKVNRQSGKAAVEYVKHAIDLTIKGETAAIATAPLNKEAMNLAGFSYPGHTEILAEATGTEDYAMMLLAGPLRVVHVTTHIALRNVSSHITKDRIIRVIQLTNQALKALGIASPKIAVAGLNPHAGEGGLFGIEEQEEIAPAVEHCQTLDMVAEGPIPPDTVFLRGSRGEFDAVVAMYHDQGHIPIKLLGFDEGVNVTIGLPIIRTSVDHGTAFDIAWKGQASPHSMIEAIKVAAMMAKSA